MRIATTWMWKAVYALNAWKSDLLDDSRSDGDVLVAKWWWANVADQLGAVSRLSADTQLGSHVGGNLSLLVHLVRRVEVERPGRW